MYHKIRVKGYDAQFTGFEAALGAKAEIEQSQQYIISRGTEAMRFFRPRRLFKP